LIDGKKLNHKILWVLTKQIINLFLGTVVGQGDTQTGISQLDFQC
jgi:hypothetical protein